MNDILLPQVLIDAVNKEFTKDEVQWNPKVFNIPDMKSSASWVGKDVTWIKPGDTIPLNWSHKASEKLGKIKKVDIHDDMVSIELLTTSPTQKWIDKLKDHIFEEENRY